MASKKMKKILGVAIAGAVGAKMLGQKKQMAEYLKSEGGDKSAVSYITKKAKPTTFMGKVKKAVNTYKTKGLNTGPGINATSKKGGTLAGDYGNAFGDGISGGAKAGKMIKARGGKMVNLKPTKLY